MGNSDRGVYQPPPEDIQVYDPAEDEEQERSRLPILIVIALLVLAAFGGVVWLAYNQGVARGRADTPRVIAAPAGPVRTAPTETNNANNAQPTPYTGLKIYNAPVPPEEEAQNSTEAPANATPLPAEAPAPAPATQEAVVPPAAQMPAPAQTAKPKAKTSSTKSPTNPPTEIAAAPAPTPVVEKAAPSPAPAASATAGGNILVQIGSYPSAALANAAWNSFLTKHAATLQSYGPDVKGFDLGAKGTWYRLRLGPFPDKAAAKAICDKLKAEGAPACILAAS
jgi:cell division protein FtsN